MYQLPRDLFFICQNTVYHLNLFRKIFKSHSGKSSGGALAALINPSFGAVTPESAMRCATVFACVRVISDAIGSAQLRLFRRSANGRERATEHPLYRLVSVAPNEYQTAFEWRQQGGVHLCLRGNFYNRIVRTGSGITAIYPMSPDDTDVLLPKDGAPLRYTSIQHDNIFERENILHVKALGSNGFKGLSPIEQGRVAIRYALGAEDHGAQMLRNGPRAGAILTHPGKLSPDAKHRLKDSVLDQAYGDSRYSLVVLEEGIKYEQMGMSATDAQFLENRKFQRNEICSLFRVPPHMVGDLERATFSNIEQQSMDFYTQTMLPWVVMWEQRLNVSLLTPKEQETYYFEFSFDNQTRADIMTRFNAYRVGLQEGFLSPNEVRAKENMDPRPGGDEYRVPANTLPSGV